MRECTWKRFKKSQLDLPVKTSLANILIEDDEASLLKGIKDNTLFGFLTCDVETPPELISEYVKNGFLFPPVIQRMELDERHLSPFMKERFIEENRKAKVKTVVQVYSIAYAHFHLFFRLTTVKESL